MKRTESCGIILFTYRDGKLRFLLLKHKNGEHWSFPKGHGNLGESPQETARRELLEETNLIAGPFIPDYYEELTYNTGPATEKRVKVFLAPYESGELKIQESEILKAKWLKKKKALKKATHVSTKALIMRAIEVLSPSDF